MQAVFALLVVAHLLRRHILSNHTELVLLLAVNVCVLLDELLEQRDLLQWVRVHRVARHHMRGKHEYDLAIGHLLVVEGVYQGQQVLDLLLRVQDVHHRQQVLELDLADDAVLVVVHRLEQIGELDEEALMLLQLEVEDDLPEVTVLELRAGLRPAIRLVVEFLAGQPLASLRELSLLVLS